uniref:Uncharacterized protein n=1 Tax=Arundo donax TaxID=35708 RepID=A0A0A8YW53_ARUDO
MSSHPSDQQPCLSQSNKQECFLLFLRDSDVPTANRE